MVKNRAEGKIRLEVFRLEAGGNMLEVGGWRQEGDWRLECKDFSRSFEVSEARDSG